MQARPFLQIDVFGRSPYLGNPLAVVANADGLDPARMQEFARWTNLSETAFLLAPTNPGADYRVRIFTPQRELPFAGHPTLGSCAAWLRQGKALRARGDEVVQECAVGLVRLRRTGERIAFAAPPLQRAPIPASTLEAILAALRLPRARLRKAEQLTNGPVWLSLLLDEATTVLGIEPDHEALRAIGLVGVIAPLASAAASARPDAFEVRAFAAADGIAEDPVTGSLNAALAQWLIAEDLAAPRYHARQGAALQRDGEIFIEASAGDVWVGGNCHACIEGTVRI